MIELERKYLAKRIPEGLESCRSEEIVDIYIPEAAHHPVTRIRKKGDKYEMTKKTPVKGADRSRQLEQTIILDKEEFDALAEIAGKRVRKLRYYWNYDGLMAEVSVFQDALEGLVDIDFEFETIEEKNAFEMPEFCLAEVTQEDFIAGGMVCGKSYEDIEPELEKFGYKKLFLEK